MDPIFEYEHPFVCTDAVIFSLRTDRQLNYRKLPEPKLQVLLYKRTSAPFENCWSLPGGFVNIDEMPEDNIIRKLSEKSNAINCYLEQLYTFASLTRDPRARVISIAYLGLMNETTTQIIQPKAEWFTITQKDDQIILENEHQTILSSDIAFDHYQIIKKGLERLQAKIWYSDIVFNLLPETFSLTELQNTFEVILNKKESTANFRRKISGLVNETNQQLDKMGHRPAKLFTKK